MCQSSCLSCVLRAALCYVLATAPPPQLHMHFTVTPLCHTPCVVGVTLTLLTDVVTCIRNQEMHMYHALVCALLVMSDTASPIIYNSIHWSPPCRPCHVPPEVCCLCPHRPSQSSWCKVCCSELTHSELTMDMTWSCSVRCTAWRQTDQVQVQALDDAHTGPVVLCYD